MTHGEAERRANSETTSREETELRSETKSWGETEPRGETESQRESGSILVLNRIAGTRCPLCDGGTLVREQYKDNRAVVCDQCDVPRAQFWANE